MIKRIVGNGDTSKLKVNVPALEASVGRFPYGLAQISCSVQPYCTWFSKWSSIDGPSHVVVLSGTGSPGRSDENKKGTKSALDCPVSISLIEDSRDEVTVGCVNTIGGCFVEYR